jgi:phosphatidylglycerol---prolipoprotein diacylglyceryl transferase
MPNLNKKVLEYFYQLKTSIFGWFRLDEFQKIACEIFFVGILLFGVCFYPIRKIFAGDWKINQQISFRLWEVDLTSSDQIFNGIINVRFYSLCILLAVLFGYFLVLILSKKHYIVSTIIDRLLVGLVVFGLLGARLFFVFFNWSVFSKDILAIFFVYQGGLAFFGMLLGGLFYIWIYCLRFKFNIFEFLDFISPGLLLGQVIGRFGNFFNYESYGGPTSVYWKMYVPDNTNVFDNLNQKFFHPTFLYEIFFNFVLLLILLWNYRSFTRRKAGIVFGLYAIGYGLIRFFVEFFRLDALIFNLPDFLTFDLFGLQLTEVRISQVMAGLLVIFGLLVLKIRSDIIYIRKSIEDIKVRKTRDFKI